MIDMVDNSPFEPALDEGLSYKPVDKQPLPFAVFVKTDIKVSMTGFRRKNLLTENPVSSVVERPYAAKITHLIQSFKSFNFFPNFVHT